MLNKQIHESVNYNRSKSKQVAESIEVFESKLNESLKILLERSKQDVADGNCSSAEDVLKRFYEKFLK